MTASPIPKPRLQPSFQWGSIAVALLLSATPSCSDDETGGEGAAAGTGGAAAAGGTAGTGGGSTACTTPADCPGQDGDCQTRTCEQGLCGVAYAAAGAACTEDGGEVCDGDGSCVKGDGQPCTDAAECLSGFCTDEICCDMACDGACEGCSVPQHDGTCTPFTPGTDPDLECGDGVCDGTGSCAEGHHIWSKRYGGSSNQKGRSIARDADGNVLLTGSFNGLVDFGPGPLASVGGNDVFLTKLNPNGSTLWSHGFGATQNQIGYAVAVDAAGNVLITGSYATGVDFSGTPLPNAGSNDVFIAKFDPDGSHLWSFGFGDASSQVAYAIAIDSAGNVIVTGAFAGSIDFGGGAQLDSAGANDVFVAKLDTAGGHVWSYGFGDAGDQQGLALAIDSSDDVLVAGHFAGTLDFGGSPLASAGSSDAFLAKLAADGSHVWSHGFGDAADQQALAVTTDVDGNVLLAGSFAGTVDLGGGGFASSGGQDGFLAKYGPDGTYLWGLPFGDADDQQALAVAADPAGNVVLTGLFFGSVSLGGDALLSAGSSDVLMAKYAPSGHHLWSQAFGDAGEQVGSAIATGPAGEVLVTGFFHSTMDLGGSQLASAGMSDIFAGMLGP